jgi:hypothetical protein
MIDLCVPYKIKTKARGRKYLETAAAT